MQRINATFVLPAYGLLIFALWTNAFAEDCAVLAETAVKINGETSADKFFDQGCNPNCISHSVPLLLYAARNDNINFVVRLLNHSVDINSTDLFGRTALHLAAENANIHLMNFLIQRGASVDQRTKFDETPLLFAAGVHQIEGLKLLLQHGVDVNPRSKQGTTPLLLAAYKGNLEAVRILLEAGADGNAPISTKSFARSVSFQFLTIIQPQDLLVHLQWPPTQEPL